VADATKTKARHAAIAGYLCLLLTLILVLLISAWGAWRDLSEGRKAFLGAEIARLHSHAKRTVGRIESYLEDRQEQPELAKVRDAEWLRDFWRQVVPRERQRLYAALVDANGAVIMHSDPSRRGKSLEPRWFEQPLPGIGDDVVKTRSTTLASGQLAYDIRVPIDAHGKEVGAYHSGFDADWLENAFAAHERTVYTRWLLVGGLLVLVVLGAGVSLFRLAGRTARLTQALSMARTQQFAELGRLAGALAHEIRNPLNAIRLNLHALARYMRDQDSMSEGDVSQMMQESNIEIERLESLIRSILGYTRPDEARAEDVDLRQELQATVNFLRQLLDRSGIGIRVETPDTPVIICIDRDRLRQMMLNLLNNAQDAVGKGGEISVALSRRDGWADITVADTGPGIPPEDSERVFEPFYTTKDKGCGLGLALVKRYAQEGGGTVTCDADGEPGGRFRIRLPEASPPRR
jgi:signal transduction histidine kinase